MDSYSITDTNPGQHTDGSLISSERVTGTNVYNQEGNKLGTIDSVMIDKHSGHVQFAVMSFGGFLGIGEKFHQLPWDGLTYDEEQQGYVVNLSREALEGAPSYSRDELDEFDYESDTASIDAYYSGVDGFYRPDRRRSMTEDGDRQSADPDTAGIQQPERRSGY